MSKSIKVLIADDDPVVLKLVSSGLRAEGFKVIACLDAYQALEGIHRERPAVAVLDIHMPAGGSPQVVERLQVTASAHRVAVIFLSGDKSPAAEEMARKLGGHELLHKPVNMPRLISAIHSAIASASDTSIAV
jgi:DNA-binding response OmpR family regulator